MNEEVTEPKWRRGERIDMDDCLNHAVLMTSRS